MPSKPGDFRYKSCAAFCKPTDCNKFCKCAACQFCAAGTASATPAPSSTKTTLSSLRKPSKGSLAAHREHNASASASNSGTHGPEGDIHQQLHSAEARARHAEERIASLEKQLSLCRHSSEKLRAGGSGGGGGSSGTMSPQPTFMSSLLNRGGRGNVTELQICSQAIRQMQMQQQASASSSDGSGGPLQAKSGAGSSRAELQLHLHLHDFATSRCPHPSQILLAGRTSSSASGGGGDVRLEPAAGADETVASLLLFVGLVLCALCNSWSLGYLQPNRTCRRALRSIGLDLEVVR